MNPNDYPAIRLPIIARGIPPMAMLVNRHNRLVNRAKNGRRLRKGRTLTRAFARLGSIEIRRILAAWKRREPEQFQ